MSTPRADIEEWFRREERRLSAKDEGEFQKKIKDYFKEADRRHPDEEKMKRLVNIAKDMRLIERIGIFRRIIRFFRGVLRR
ncbi:hypothetical protein AC481_02480 [miscellaneous Crenarchaeota group archaeon SMTZ-80]|nr:MAG: hypothetical protein AC481_02480 [miscellaneous Crenarchaeota group archaeon SMTZ-80]